MGSFGRILTAIAHGPFQCIHTWVDHRLRQVSLLVADIYDSLMDALGPYAFMDIFDRMHICNHTDEEGRYAYRVGFFRTSPIICIDAMIGSVPAGDDVSTIASATLQRSHFYKTGRLFALRALLNTLSPLVGAEAELGDKAVSAGWAKEATKDKVSEWSSKGVSLVKEELEDIFRHEYEVEYNARMRQARSFYGPWIPMSHTLLS